MSIFTFTGIVLALPVGMLSRKFGPKNLIIAALILDIIASVAGAFVNDIALLLVTRALEGASLVCVIACGPVVLQQTVDPARMGIATGIWMLGGMLGATFGGIFTPLLYYNTGFVGLWIGYAIFAAIALIAFVLVIKMPPVDTHVAEQEALANASKTFGERSRRSTASSSSRIPGCSTCRMRFSKSCSSPFSRLPPRLFSSRVWIRRFPAW